MIVPLTPNTQAILLLTAPLIVGRSEGSSERLTLSEYNRLARLLREKQKEPADLIGPDAGQTVSVSAAVLGRERLENLLGRGFLLSQAVERWNARATEAGAAGGLDLAPAERALATPQDYLPRTQASFAGAMPAGIR